MREIILITGATGFVGFKTVLTALHAGYNVRAVIRKPEQAEKLQTHVKIVPHADRLEFAVVPDLAEDGAFDHVLGDVVAILHLASPMTPETTEYERDIINPAIEISTALLKCALKAPKIRRVIITSSVVTLMPFEWLFNPDDRVFTAQDINGSPSRSASNPDEAYWSAKAFARAAATEFVKTHHPHFELIQLLPGVILGRDERAAAVTDLRNGVPQWAMRMAPVLGTSQAAPMGSVPVDVEDVAKAHVDAIKPVVPGNTDYILCSGPTTDIVWDDMIEVAKKYFPKRAGSKEMPLGGKLPTMKWHVDTTKTEKAFGWKFKTFEEVMKATIGQYVELLD